MCYIGPLCKWHKTTHPYKLLPNNTKTGLIKKTEQFYYIENIADNFFKNLKQS
jgi:hypothetical protein